MYWIFKKGNVIVTNYFITFLQMVDVVSFFIVFLLGLLLTLLFSFINNYSSH